MDTQFIGYSEGAKKRLRRQLVREAEELDRKPRDFSTADRPDMRGELHRYQERLRVIYLIGRRWRPGQAGQVLPARRGR